MNVVRVAAPALAGILLAFIGVGGIYMLTVASFVVAVTTLLRVPRSKVKQAVSTSLLGSVADGLRYVWREALLFPLIVWSALLGMFGMSYQSLLPVFSQEVLNVGATGYGAMTSATGLGALVGSLVIASLGNFRRKGALQAA